jgi:Ubiquitin C-terminal hydrolase
MVLLDKLDSELKELHPNKFSIISDLFQGKVRNSIICGLCDKKSSNIEEFTQLALPIIQSSEYVKLDALLSIDESRMITEYEHS